MNNDRIYYFSNIDNQIHNIHDISYQVVRSDIIEILDSDKYVIDTVVLHSLDEVISLLKEVK